MGRDGRSGGRRVLGRPEGGVRRENMSPRDSTYGAVTSALLLGIGSAMMFVNPTVVQFRSEQCRGKGL